MSLMEERRKGSDTASEIQLLRDIADPMGELRHRQERVDTGSTINQTAVGQKPQFAIPKCPPIWSRSQYG